MPWYHLRNNLLRQTPTITVFDLSITNIYYQSEIYVMTISFGVMEVIQYKGVLPV